MDTNILNRGDYREALLSGSHIKVGSIWADGHTSVGTLDVRGSSLLEGNLRVKQSASLEGPVSMSKNLSVRGAVRITGSSGETYKSGSQTITAPALAVSGTSVLAGDLEVLEDVRIGGSPGKEGGKLYVSGTSYFTGSMQISSSLAVTGSVIVRENVNANNLFITGNSQVGHNSEISGNLWVSQSASVLGNTYLEQNLWVRKNVQIDGDLYVSGTMTKIGTEDLVVKDKYIEIASGSTTPEMANGAGFYISGANVWITHSTRDNQIQINEGIRADGDSDISGNLDVTGTGSFGSVDISGPFNLAGSASIGGELHVTGSTVLGKGLTVYGTSSFEGPVGVQGPLSASSFYGDGRELYNVTCAIATASMTTANYIAAAGEEVDFKHKFHTDNITVTVYQTITSSAGREIVQVTPAKVQLIDGDTARVKFASAAEGYAVITDAGHLVTASADIQEVTTFSASYTVAAGETKQFQHRLGTTNVICAVYAKNGSITEQIVPDSLRITSPNVVTVRFAEAATGHVVIAKAGQVLKTTSLEEAATYTASFDANSGSRIQFRHNFATENVFVQVWKTVKNYGPGTHEELHPTITSYVPAKIEVTGVDTVEVSFAERLEGYVVIGKAGHLVMGYDDLDNKNVHYGTTGSWSAREYETDFLEVNQSASITRLVVPKEGFIDAYKVGNRTADQGYTPVHGQGGRDWNTYTLYETNSIDQYISEGATIEPVKVSSIDGRGNLTIKGDLITNHAFVTSDLRKKYNISPLQGSLENINKIRGVAFRWTGSSERDLGVIAQEVQEVYPELVKEASDGILRVNETGLIAPLLEAVKELKRKVDMLEEKIRFLEEK